MQLVLARVGLPRRWRMGHALRGVRWSPQETNACAAAQRRPELASVLLPLGRAKLCVLASGYALRSPAATRVRTQRERV